MLFQKMLSSLFPKHMLEHPMNPISAFISFILPKQFFSIINRKVVENYKLNMFDISLESFDARVGFWEDGFLKPKELEFDYYWYNVVSNLNWYRFFSPWMLATIICFLDSNYSRKKFWAEKISNQKLFFEWSKTLYLLTFVFFSRVKVFPYKNDRENFNWYIKLLNNFFAFRLTKAKIKISSQKYEKLFSSLVSDLQLHLFIFEILKKLNNILQNQTFWDKEVYAWIFSWDMRKHEAKFLYDEWLHNVPITSKETFFSSNEINILESILPADILINYLFDGKNFALWEIASGIYDKKKLDEILKNIEWENFEKALLYLTDYNNFKNNYFEWAKKYFSSINEDQDYLELEAMQKQLDELAKIIEKEGDLPKGVKIPERFKNESIMFEKIVNFYITFIGGFWIARWDNYYLRLFRKEKIQNFVAKNIQESLKQDAMFFYGWIFYNYSKNLFFYKYVFDKVKSGQERFTLPFRSTFRDVHANIYLIYLMSENFLINVLQDINFKDIKLNIKDEKILNHFRKDYLPAVQTLLQSKDILKSVYQKIFYFTDFDQKFFTSQDEFNLKENIYCLDFWLWFETILNIKNQKIDFLEKYSVLSIIWIFSFLRETLFWYFLLRSYFEKNNTWKQDIFLKVYLIDIVWITDQYLSKIANLLENIYQKHKNILTDWIELDENKSFLQLWEKSRTHFIKDKSDSEIISWVSGEDINWLRWYLKNIVFYNKKYILPFEL